MTNQLAISTLALQHRIPDDWAADPWAEVRPVIDGVDVEVHPEGVALSCRHWPGPAESWPLAVTEEPRRVMITAAVGRTGRTERARCATSRCRLNLEYPNPSPARGRLGFAAAAARGVQWKPSMPGVSMEMARMPGG
jgi:hypothetical protein